MWFLLSHKRPSPMKLNLNFHKGFALGSLAVCTYLTVAIVDSYITRRHHRLEQEKHHLDAINK